MGFREREEEEEQEGREREGELVSCRFKRCLRLLFLLFCFSVAVVSCSSVSD